MTNSKISEVGKAKALTQWPSRSINEAVKMLVDNKQPFLISCHRVYLTLLPEESSMMYELVIYQTYRRKDELGCMLMDKHTFLGLVATYGLKKLYTNAEFGTLYGLDHRLRDIMRKEISALESYETDLCTLQGICRKKDIPTAIREHLDGAIELLKAKIQGYQDTVVKKEGIILYDFAHIKSNKRI